MSSFLGVSELQDSAKFLGHPLFFSRNKAQDFNFVINRVAARLEGWQAKLLSHAGRDTFFKSVAQAIPIDTMSTFRLLVAVMDKLDALARRFWWSGDAAKTRCWSLKAWEALCKLGRFLILPL